LNRYLRLTPVYALVLILYIGLGPTAAGPTGYYVSHDVELCRKQVGNGGSSGGGAEGNIDVVGEAMVVMMVVVVVVAVWDALVDFITPW